MLKKLLSISFLVFCSLHLIAREQKAVIIIVDGIPADMVERLELPSVYDMARQGSYGPSHVGGTVGTYNETPTISAVGYNCMLTGTWANKHNVFGNDNLSPNYNYWSIFRIAKAQKEPLKTAIFSSWTDNRTVLLGEGKKETANLEFDFIYDGYDLDTLNYPHKEYHLHVFDYDEVVSSNAAECIRDNAPDLSWVYLWYTDDAGHYFGDGELFDEYAYKADKQIGMIWDAVKYREKAHNEDWMIIVLTDHGRDYDGFHHGGQSARERGTWIASNHKLNRYFREGKSAIVDVNPTVCDFLDLEVPDMVRWEQDGISLIGKTIVEGLSLSTYDTDVILKWKAGVKSAPVGIYAAKANEYALSGTEEWIKVAEVNAGVENYRISLKELGYSPFYKFVVKSEHESLNLWLNNRRKW